MAVELLSLGGLELVLEVGELVLGGALGRSAFFTQVLDSFMRVRHRSTRVYQVREKHR